MQEKSHMLEKFDRVERATKINAEHKANLQMTVDNMNPFFQESLRRT